MKRTVLENKQRAKRLEPEEFQALIFKWFSQFGRSHLPWQKSPTAYRVWVSEIMLQQTQVATVIPYYERFMLRFTTLSQLAKAPLDEVLSYWSGLGYYARARNLHRTAQIIVNEHAGRFPNELERMMALPGIGRSTAGAIASLSMGQATPILDGNVKRVLSRFFALEGWPGRAEVLNTLWAVSTQYTPLKKAGTYNQAMMDLGATVCTRRKPACDTCPLSLQCVAKKEQLTECLPTPKAKTTLPVRQKHWLVLHNEDGVLLTKQAAKGLWGGLWVLPQLNSFADVKAWCEQEGIATLRVEEKAARRHTFSHFHLDYTPVYIKAEARQNRIAQEREMCWYRPENDVKLGLPTPVNRLINRLFDTTT